MDFNKIFTQKIDSTWLKDKNVALDVLRLDVLHPVVSGNKWFKLKGYLAEAKAKKRTTIATFGGAFSNHIIATAFACKEYGFRSTGFIRGEQAGGLSHTLKYASQLGMQLNFLSRSDYRDKAAIINSNSDETIYWIEEGGYGETGAVGASEILRYANLQQYTHLIAAVGTGTLLAGLIRGSDDNQQVIGISSMRGNTGLEAAVRKLLPADKLSTTIRVLHEYHFGGYAKHPPELIRYINHIYAQHQLPLDIIYTSKAFYAINDLVNNNFFMEGSKLLMIHSGGLQGNHSLPRGALSFL